MVTSHAPPTVAVHQDASEGIDAKGNNPGETSEAAKQGRSFDVKVSPRETWDAVFETVMGELRAEGHENLLVYLKKKVSLKSVSISISYDRGAGWLRVIYKFLLATRVLGGRGESPPNIVYG